MDLKGRIDELSSLMADFGLAEAELKGDGWRVALKKKSKPSAAPAVSGDSASGAEVEHAPFEPAALAPADAPKPKGTPVNSPMTGIYYSSSSPSAPPFVKEGDVVEAGQVVGLIEAMKVYNELVSPIAGTVVEIVAKNAQLVQPGEALMYIA